MGRGVSDRQPLNPQGRVDHPNNTRSPPAAQESPPRQHHQNRQLLPVRQPLHPVRCDHPDQYYSSAGTSPTVTNRGRRLSFVQSPHQDHSIDSSPGDISGSASAAISTAIRSLISSSTNNLISSSQIVFPAMASDNQDALNNARQQQQQQHSQERQQLSQPPKDKDRGPSQGTSNGHDASQLSLTAHG